MSNILQRLIKARTKFHSLELKKTGKNAYAGYSYFELGDFLIPAMKCLAEQELLPVITFNEERAIMTVYDASSSDEVPSNISITSPMREANLKGCHPIQNLGAVQTYQRRYLWVTLMEIVEHDMLDSSEPIGEKPKAVKKKATTKKVTSKKTKDTPEYLNKIKDSETAEHFVGMMISEARKNHSSSLKELYAFWRDSTEAVDFLSAKYPPQFETLQQTFSELKAEIQEENEDV